MRMLSNKINWNLNRAVIEKKTKKWTTDKVGSEKLNWAFDSGELKIVDNGLYQSFLQEVYKCKEVLKSPKSITKVQ